MPHNKVTIVFAGHFWENRNPEKLPGYRRLFRTLIRDRRRYDNLNPDTHLCGAVLSAASESSIFRPDFLVLGKDSEILLPVFFCFVLPGGEEVISRVPFEPVSSADEPMRSTDIQIPVIAPTLRAVSKLAGFREFKDKTCTHGAPPFEAI